MRSLLNRANGCSRSERTMLRSERDARGRMYRHLLSRALLLLLLGDLLRPELHAATGIQIEKRREYFRSGGKRISVETFAPAGEDRLPAVLVLHSAAGTLVGKGELERFSRSVAAQGKVALLVRYFDRTRTVFAGDGTIDKYTGAWLETVKDAVTFATAHPRVQPESIGMFGYSLGAYLAVAQSSRDSRVNAVVEIAGGILAGYEPRMHRLPPTLVLHGSADQRVPLSEAREIQRAARRFGRPAEVKIYPGEGHRLSPSASADATQRALAFLKRHLPGPRSRR